MFDIIQSHGANLNGRDHSGATPLHYAAHGGDGVSNHTGVAMVEKLIAKKVQIDVKDEDERTALLWAASSGEINGRAWGGVLLLLFGQNRGWNCQK